MKKCMGIFLVNILSFSACWNNSDTDWNPAILPKCPVSIIYMYNEGR